MKVLLLKNVKNLGTAGHIVDVAAGYAQNKLIPSRLAKIATLSEEATAKNIDAVKAQNSAEFVEWAKMAITKLEGKSLAFEAKASDKGHLFGSVSEADIAEKIKAEFNLEVEVAQVHLVKHIKDLGDHSVEIALSPEYSANITVQVVEA